MDEEAETTAIPTVGERLRAAREDKGLSLEDIASETRIPCRHLESIETGDWERLPAPTYTMGFAKSYAGAVGLDRREIADQLRAETGGYRTEPATVEHFEPVDPARTMPRWLVVSAIAAILVVVLVFTWIQNRSMSEAPAIPEATVAQQPTAPAPGYPAAIGQTPTQMAQGPVVLTATAAAWIQVRDQGKTLFEGLLNPGQTYQVPPSATAPLLKAGKPEALRITVGDSVAPPVGPAGQIAADVSLRPADLMKNPGSPQASASGDNKPQNTVAH